MRVFLTGNSPGELAGWVAPVAEELKTRSPESEVIVVLTPCQYASGTERAYASKLAGVDRVVRLREILRRSDPDLRAQSPAGRHRIKVVYLGGDAYHAVRLAKKLNAPLAGYLHNPRWRRHFDTYYVADEKTGTRFAARGVQKEKIEVVGHLGLDSCRVTASRERILSDLGLPDDGAPIVSFLPGSRPDHVRFLIPFFVETAQLLSESIPEVRMFAVMSPFAERGWVNDALRAAGGHCMPALEDDTIICASGCRLRVLWKDTYDAMSVSQLMITIPGTNTLQAAGLGVPMVVVVPLQRGEYIPLDGLAGLILPRRYPFGLIKRWLILAKNRRMGNVALPNMLAGGRIVPELRGRLKPNDVACESVAILRDDKRRKEMCEALKRLNLKPGAAARIAQHILLS